MQCNVLNHFHLCQSTVKPMSFSTLAVSRVPFAVYFVPWTLWFLLIFKCVSEARQNKPPKLPLKLCGEHLAFWAPWGGHLFWFLRHLDTCIFKARSSTWLKGNQMIFFFFCWKEMFLHEKHCICCPRCRHFYKSEFRFHSLLAHFIICIFLLYRLNIFCQLMTFFFLWTVLKPQLSWWWINCAPLVLGYSVGWMHTS